MMNKGTVRTCLIALVVVSIGFTTVSAQSAPAAEVAQDAAERQLSGTSETSVMALVEAWLSHDTSVSLSVGAATSVDVYALERIEGVSWRRLNLAGDILRITLYGEATPDRRGVLNSEWLVRSAFVVNYRVASDDTSTLFDCTRLFQEKAPLGSWRTTDTYLCNNEAQKTFENIRKLEE